MGAPERKRDASPQTAITDGLSSLSTVVLLRLHAEIIELLRTRGVLRSRNNPIADYAEHLFCEAFGLKLVNLSAEGLDAIDNKGVRYQVKYRRITRRNPSRLLGALRGLPEHKFDILGGLLLNENFEVLRAALIPYRIARIRAKFHESTNSWRFHLRNSVWSIPGVVDVTQQLRNASLASLPGHHP